MTTLELSAGGGLAGAMGILTTQPFGTIRVHVYHGEAALVASGLR